MFGLFRRRKKATLVLGGGSARGIAHVGVLKVLEREKIPIERIVGTSMGALIGAAYSVGIPIRDLEEKAYNYTLKDLFDPTIPKMGLLAGNKLERSIKYITNNKEFKDCKVPLAVVTTNIETGEEVVFQSGDLSQIIRASCSWPGIFNPVEIGGRLLVDGGIKNSVPTKIARTFDPEYIIAVDVGFCVKQGKINSLFEMLLQSFQIMGHELNIYQAYDSESAISVDLGDIDQAAFHRAREAVAKGSEAAEKKIGIIKREMGL